MGGTPPEHRGPNRNDGGNSAMALIVGALAVALIIGAFFWFAGDNRDTATLDDPAVTEQGMGTTTQQDSMTGQGTLGSTDQQTTTTTQQDTTVTEVEPTQDDEVIDQTQQQGTTGQTQTQDDSVIDETQQQ